MSSSIKIMRVRVPAEGFASEPVQWIMLNSLGRAVERGNCLLSELPAAADIELVIPASLVAQHVLELPPIAAKHERAVIEQQLEDRVIGGLADCHFIRGERQGNTLAVWLVSRKWMQTLLSACDRADAFPKRIIAEQALLPKQSFALTDAGLVFRTTAGNCGILPDSTLIDMISPEPLAEVEDLLAAPVATAMDLLQGLPSSRKHVALPVPLIKAAACLVLASMALFLLSEFLMWRQLSAQEARLHEAIRQNFAAAYPGVPIVDPILQWRQLNGKQHGGMHGDILDQLGQLASMTGVSIHPQRVEAEGDSIKLTLGSADAATLKPALTDKHVRFETQTTDSGLIQIVITRNPGRGES